MLANPKIRSRLWIVDSATVPNDSRAPIVYGASGLTGWSNLAHEKRGF
jgi:hypothetical protein